MIEKLTPDQEALIPIVRDEYIKHGLSTDPGDFERAKEAIAQIYRDMGMKVPPFIFLPSPVACLTAIHRMEEWEKTKTVSKFTKKQWAELQAITYKDKPKALKWHSCFWGQFEVDWIASFDFYRRIGVEYSEKLQKQFQLWVDISKSISWWWPFEEACIICDRPLAIHRNANGLHCETGKAVEFRDGWGLYFLNGVVVSEELVMTPADQIPANWAIKESNAEVRREIVRKIGAERLLNELNAEVIDAASYGPFFYWLYMLDIGDGRKRPYLKMNNASLEAVVHVEPVRPGIKSVREAIMFRNNLSEKDIDEDNGADYYQQGDVLLFPVGAKKFKLFPKTLT